MALTLDQLNAITKEHYIPQMVDNIFNSNPLLARWKKNSNVYTSVKGGTSIRQPLLYAAGTSGGWFSGADTLSTTDNEQFTAAQYEWRHIYESIAITRENELMNSGEEQVINMVTAKVQSKEITLMDTLGTGLFNAGSTTDAIEGLRAMVNTTSPTTYGGISGTDYSWWRGTIDSSTTAMSIAKLQAGYGDVTIDGDKPSVAVTTQNLFDKYMNLLQPQQRFSDPGTANAGFQNLLFRGVPVVVDSHCPSGYWFFLNEKYIKFYYHPDENFRMEPFRKPIDQAVAVAQIFWMGNLGTSNRRMNMVFSALTES